MMNVTDVTIADVSSVEDVERLMKMAERHRTVKVCPAPHPSSLSPLRCK